MILFDTLPEEIKDKLKVGFMLDAAAEYPCYKFIPSDLKYYYVIHKNKEDQHADFYYSEIRDGKTAYSLITVSFPEILEGKTNSYDIAGRLKKQLDDWVNNNH